MKKTYTLEVDGTPLLVFRSENSDTPAEGYATFVLGEAPPKELVDYLLRHLASHWYPKDIHQRRLTVRLATREEHVEWRTDSVDWQIEREDYLDSDNPEARQYAKSYGDDSHETIVTVLGLSQSDPTAR